MFGQTYRHRYEGLARPTVDTSTGDTFGLLVGTVRPGVPDAADQN